MQFCVGRRGLAADYRRLCEASLLQTNYSMVLRCLRNMKTLMDGDKELQQQHDLLYSKAWVLNTSLAAGFNTTDKFSKLFRHFLKHRAAVGGDKSVLLETRVVVFTRLLAMVVEESSVTTSAVEATMRQEEDRQALRQALGSEGTSLRAGLEREVMAAMLEQQEAARGEEVGRSHQAVADFAFKLWRSSRKGVGVVAVKQHMAAVRAGHLRARQLFPRLLELLQDSEAAEQFVEGHRSPRSNAPCSAPWRFWTCPCPRWSRG